MSDSLSTTLLVAFIVVVFPIVLGTLWIGVTLFMSLVGGWRRLGKLYPAPLPLPTGRRLSGVTGMFGVASYKRVLTVTTTSDGLVIENRFVFRPGHPPLFIPFSAMHDMRKQMLYFWEYAAFDVGDPSVAAVRLPTKVFEGTGISIAR